MSGPEKTKSGQLSIEVSVPEIVALIQALVEAQIYDAAGAATYEWNRLEERLQAILVMWRARFYA